MIELFVNGLHSISYPEGILANQHNGDAILLPTSCIVTAQVNGTWELTLDHPLDEEGRWQYIQQNNILRVPSHNGIQLFRIKRVEKNDDSIHAQADPIFFDSANDCFLLDVRPTSKTGQAALTDILTNAKYSGVSNITKTSTAYYIRKNAMEAINGSDDSSFLNRWGGEIEYDNLTIKINRRLGADNGVLVRTGKNLPKNGLRYTADISNVINRIIPLAFNGYKMSGASPWVDTARGPGEIVHAAVISFENIRLASDNGYSAGQTVPSYITNCADQAALDTALQAAATDYFTKTNCSLPYVTLEADIAVLQALDEYREFEVLEEIGLGDTIHVYDRRLGVGVDRTAEGNPLYSPVPARVMEIEWDCIRNRASAIKARSENDRTSFSGASEVVGSEEPQKDSGTYVYKSGGTVSNFESGTTWQNVMTLTVPPGSWVYFVTVGFSSNATGRRAACLSTSATGSQTGWNVLAIERANSGAYTVLRFGFPIQTDTEQTFYINAYQNSGSALSVYPRIHGIKI